MIQVAEAVTLTASGTIATGDGVLVNMLLGLDKLNDPELTVYNGQDNTGTELIPTNTYDASALGLNGLTGAFVRFRGGAYYEVDENQGAVEATFHIIHGG